MASEKRLKKYFNQFADKKQPKPQMFSGLLGSPVDSGTVEVPGRTGYVYVRLRDNQNEIIQAYNDKVAPVYDLPVLVARDVTHANRYFVIGRDIERYVDWGTSSPYLPKHGISHSFNLEKGGGGDIVWVYSKQLMPLLVMPSGTAGAPNAVVSAGIYYKGNSWGYAGDTGTASLLPYKPTGTDTARMVMVYLDSDTGVPGIATGTLTEFSASITGTADVLPYIPTLPSTSYIPLAAVRLVTGTSVINWDNLYDLRPWVVSDAFLPTGTGGGSVEFATLAEAQAGTIKTKAVNPYGLPLRVVNGALVRRDGYSGNQRGYGAVDLQRVRSADNQVAAGGYSALIAGKYNRIGIYSEYSAIVGGYHNSVYDYSDYSAILGGYKNRIIHSGYGAVLGGYYNAVSGSSYGLALGGDYNDIAGSSHGVIIGSSHSKIAPDGTYQADGAVIMGGLRNRAYARYSAVIGGFGGRSRIFGEKVLGAHRISQIGDAQTSVVFLYRTTTSGTETEMFASSEYGAASWVRDRLILPDNTTWTFRAQITARRTDSTGENAGWEVSGVVNRDTGQSSVSLVGLPVKTILYKDNTAWDVNVYADTTNGALKITVTGEAGKIIRWDATVHLTQISG